MSSALARARAGRSVQGPTPATKKLENTVSFGGVQTLPRRSPDASRPLIQAGSRLSTITRGQPRPAEASRGQPRPNPGQHKTTAGLGPGRYSEASHRSKQLFQPPKQVPGVGRATVSVGGAQLKLGDPIWMREEDRGSAEARLPAQQVCPASRLVDNSCAPHIRPPGFSRWLKVRLLYPAGAQPTGR